MFEALIERWKKGVQATLTSVAFALIASVMLAFALVFLAAALFVWTARTYGTIEACVAFGVFFLLLAAIGMTAALVISRRHKAQERIARAAKPRLPPWWQDPKNLALAFELTKGMRKRGLLPLGVAGAFVVGLIMSRQKEPPAS